MAGEDPSVSGVSGRYATALFELARDEKSIDAVRTDLDRFEARKRVLARLEEQGRLVKVDPYRHSLGYCQRCDTVIEPLVIPDVMKTAFGVSLRNFMSKMPHATVASSPAL